MIPDGWKKDFTIRLDLWRVENRQTGVVTVMWKAKGKARLKDRRGFSLAETLLAVLILLLVSVVVATGMPAATNAYNKVILGANAKTMLSTTVTALHDEIGTAWQVENSSDETSLTYFNGSTGAKSKISSGENLPIRIQDYMSMNDDLIHSSDATVGREHDLVSGASFKPEMYVTFESISYADGIVTITGLKVCKTSDNTELATFSGADGSFTIRVISADVKGT